jgi:hypothetical protein
MQHRGNQVDLSPEIRSLALQSEYFDVGELICGRMCQERWHHFDLT